MSDERASAAPNSPVWKNKDGSRFIFNTGHNSNWKIGKEESLTTHGSIFCEGKHILMIFTIASIV